ncbi:hypothetical protein R3P38DRAFT_3265832 [Favolaschia claudopus]|uniref:Uncharacterized protein n=1 Tax=Favolaschia claudopus TaxID=2862362 RepID=A0AAW0BYY2_9AGAR
MFPLNKTPCWRKGGFLNSSFFYSMAEYKSSSRATTMRLYASLAFVGQICDPDSKIWSWLPAACSVDLSQAAQAVSWDKQSKYASICKLFWSRDDLLAPGHYLLATPFANPSTRYARLRDSPSVLVGILPASTPVTAAPIPSSPATSPRRVFDFESGLFRCFYGPSRISLSRQRDRRTGCFGSAALPASPIRPRPPSLLAAAVGPFSCLRLAAPASFILVGVADTARDTDEALHASHGESGWHPRPLRSAAFRVNASAADATSLCLTVCRHPDLLKFAISMYKYPLFLSHSLFHYDFQDPSSLPDAHRNPSIPLKLPPRDPFPPAANANLGRTIQCVLRAHHIQASLVYDWVVSVITAPESHSLRYDSEVDTHIELASQQLASSWYK